MHAKKITLFLITSFWVLFSMAQFCSPLGGTPTGAYPLCGNVTITRSSPPVCVNKEVWVPTCSGNIHILPNVYKDVNPAWFKFTCYQAGTFGFLITPDNLNDDYNWNLFDITGSSPTVVFNSHTVTVAGNWAGTPGITGASPTGAAGVFACFSDAAAAKPPISPMPSLIVGHNYMLLVSHFDGVDGFTLTVGGGTADITDPTIPHVRSISTQCPGSPLTVTFTKKVRCNSLGGNYQPMTGAEFSISPPLATVLGGIKYGCENTYETDSVDMSLSSTLPPGNYELVIQNGFDGNTALDFCDNGIPVGERFPFVIKAPVYPHMDSIVQPSCSPNELILYFKKPIRCASISPNGSQFTISGPSPITILNARDYCSSGPDGTGNIIKINLTAPIFGKGNFQIKLKMGDDGMQLQDECFFTVPAGETLNFVTKDTVNADFDYIVRLGCKRDTIDFTHSGANEVNSWSWDFDGLQTSSVKDPRIFYDSFGLKHVQLIVSNGACSDTSSVTIFLDNQLNVGFETLDLVCPGQLVTFKDTSVGHIVSRLWTFGNGNTSKLKTPPAQTYLVPPVNTTVIAQLSVTDNIGCTKLATKKITLADICYVYVPGAFTPNRDGLNDYLYPLNVFNSTGFRFKVYNRYGQIMFESADPSSRWDGRFKGQVADSGSYVWILEYIDNNSGRTITQRGSTILIR